MLDNKLFFQWMICFNHKIKIITHLHIDHLAWIEDKDVKDDIKEAREKIKTALKPGQHPGGSKEDNIGVAYDCPDAKVSDCALVKLQLNLSNQWQISRLNSQS